MMKPTVQERTACLVILQTNHENGTKVQRQKWQAHTVVGRDKKVHAELRKKAKRANHNYFSSSPCMEVPA
jgi:hypothetical protein